MGAYNTAYSQVVPAAVPLFKQYELHEDYNFIFAGFGFGNETSLIKWVVCCYGWAVSGCIRPHLAGFGFGNKTSPIKCVVGAVDG